MDDVALTIRLPEAPPVDLELFVYRELGILPDVSGPRRRRADLTPAIVSVAESFLADLIASRGEQALLAVIDRLRRRTDTGAAAPTEREVELTVDGREHVTFVFDGDSTADDRAVRAVLDIGGDRDPDGARLRWHRAAGTWDLGPGE